VLRSPPMQLRTISESRCFGGVQGVYSHASTSTGTEMRLSVYVPEQARSGPLPVVIYLSGLSCTEENFTVKAGAQRYAAELGLIVVAPDTSPRGPGVPDDPAYDLGQGAGFYVDATEPPWAPQFRMYSYVAEELPALIAANFPQRAGALGIMGHSMGGHGALVLGLRQPERFASVSALAPIATPSQVPWGIKAFSAYLGPDPTRTCDGADRGRPPPPGDAADRSRRGGQVPRRAAPAGGVRGGLRARGPAGRGAPPPRLRPQLLLRRHGDRRAPALPRGAAGAPLSVEPQAGGEG
jgi:S-formylglutathione hydrolase